MIQNKKILYPLILLVLLVSVGGGWFLPRMPGQTGIWLALTGARIKAADGRRTHHVTSPPVAALRPALRRGPWRRPARVP